MTRGLLLAGGTGSRLRPLTSYQSKHLLNVYNKPLIFYPLSTLLLADVSELLIVVNERDVGAYFDLLGDGSHLGISIQYQIQREPRGISDGILLAESFAQGENLWVALGDNIFFGAGLGPVLRESGASTGADVFIVPVADASRYGVITVDHFGRPVNLVEKPEKPESDLAVTGLYRYDASVFDRIRDLEPSFRGELEVTDLNNSFLRDGQLQAKMLPRGTAWFDAGTFQSLHEASEFVKVIETRQGVAMASPEEVSWKRGRISESGLMMAAARYKGSPYADYLKGLARFSLDVDDPEDNFA